MPMWLQAGLWGALAGSALVLGALAGYFARLPQVVFAGVMSFGSGVLLSALAFDLLGEAWERGGFLASAAGFFAGAIAYTIANWALGHHGAHHRKRSGHQMAHDQRGASPAGSGLAIAVGALLDGIPESMVIGLSLLHGGAVGLVAVVAVFLSNVPEGMSSSSGMRNAGRSAAYVFGVWVSIAVLSGLAAVAGFVLFRGAAPQAVAAVTAVAAGAMLAMISDTMIPEAFEEARNLAGLLTVVGFLLAFVLSKSQS